MRGDFDTQKERWSDICNLGFVHTKLNGILRS